MSRITRTLVVSSFVLLVTTLARAEWFVVGNPATQNPEAVWSEQPPNQSTAIILYSYLDGQNWAPSETLGAFASGTASPVLAFDSSGGRRVVWEGGTGEILMRWIHPSEENWSDEVVLSENGETGYRPRAIVSSGETFVAYEAGTASLRSVKVSKMDSEGTVERSLLSETDFDAPLEIEIHVREETLWIDWIETDKLIGFRVWNGQEWSAMQTESYEGPGGLEEARARVRALVLNGM